MPSLCARFLPRARRYAVIAALAAVLFSHAAAVDDAAARSVVTRETTKASRALNSGMRALARDQESRTARHLRRAGRHFVRAARGSTRRLRVLRSNTSSAALERSVTRLLRLGRVQARSAERLTRRFEAVDGTLRRSLAIRIARDALGWRRSARKAQRAIAQLDGRRRPRAERRLASFLRARLRRAERLRAATDVERNDRLSRRVLREISRSERTATRMLRSLGEEPPAPSGGTEGAVPPGQGTQPGGDAATPAPSPPEPPLEPGMLLLDRFDRARGPNDLITNHFAFLHYSDPNTVRSPTWELTSGTLFHQAGTGWTGAPTFCSSDRYSQTCTGSVIFRMRSKAESFGDVQVSSRIRHNGFTESAERPAVPSNGIHIWPRYETQYRLYVASVFRRDGLIKLRKKCEGGPSNNGTYYTLAYSRDFALGSGAWHDLAVSARTIEQGAAVELRLHVNGAEALVATDRGTGCAPILGPGRVGVRGDNADFNVDDVTVRRLDG